MKQGGNALGLSICPFFRPLKAELLRLTTLIFGMYVDLGLAFGWLEIVGQGHKIVGQRSRSNAKTSVRTSLLSYFDVKVKVRGQGKRLRSRSQVKFLVHTSSGRY